MAAINRDPEVTRYLNRQVDPPAVHAFFDLVVDHWREHGFGFYAVDLCRPAGGEEFIGFVGVAYPTFLPELADRPELGWRLARSAWGRGYATEAALAARDDAFARLGLRELISIIDPDNKRSRRVAEKLGMSIERQVHNSVVRRSVDVWWVESTRTDRDGFGFALATSGSE
jgi:RimJ/RimL family protein N-acetyltransferase